VLADRRLLLYEGAMGALLVAYLERSARSRRPAPSGALVDAPAAGA
jgi:hypothetical protein